MIAEAQIVPSTGQSEQIHYPVMDAPSLDPTECKHPLRQGKMKGAASLPHTASPAGPLPARELIARADRIEGPWVADSARATSRQLIVGHYHDINHALERLMPLLTGPDVELCVAGADDRANYHWRGSSGDIIVRFHRAPLHRAGQDHQETGAVGRADRGSGSHLWT